MSQLTDFQLRLLEMFRWFHILCRKHGLRYYMLGGTMLGAVRHQGFIPWDDDIDVGMPRADYKKLQKIMKKLPEPFYVLENPGEDINYFEPFSKIYDTRTTLIENKKIPLKRGIYLDIFPLDGLGESEREAQENFKSLERKQNLLLARTTGIRKGRSLLKNLSIYVARLIPNGLLNNQKLLLSIVSDCQKYDFDSCRYVGNLVGAWRFREVMQALVYGKPTLYKFENIEVYGVANYEVYLSRMYGDWKQLPPKEKQVTHHDFIYINLEEPYMKGARHD